jgi:hypothetical protein
MEIELRPAFLQGNECDCGYSMYLDVKNGKDPPIENFAKYESAVIQIRLKTSSGNANNKETRQIE